MRDGQLKLLDIAINLTPSGSRILDVGSGAECECAIQFALRVPQSLVYAVDPAIRHGIVNLPNLKPICAPIEALSASWRLLDVTYQYVILWASHVLEHQCDLGRFLEACLEMVKPGAWLFFLVPPYKTQVVGGHVSVWFPGLLLYNLVLAGIDCRNASVKKIGYNIACFVKYKPFDLPPLKNDAGDIETLAPWLPEGMGGQGFEGDFDELNWPPVPEKMEAGDGR